MTGHMAPKQQRGRQLADSGSRQVTSKQSKSKKDKVITRSRSRGEDPLSPLSTSPISSEGKENSDAGKWRFGGLGGIAQGVKNKINSFRSPPLVPQREPLAEHEQGTDKDEFGRDHRPPPPLPSSVIQSPLMVVVNAPVVDEAVELPPAASATVDGEQPGATTDSCQEGESPSVAGSLPIAPPKARAPVPAFSGAGPLTPTIRGGETGSGAEWRDPTEWTREQTWAGGRGHLRTP